MLNLKNFSRLDRSKVSSFNLNEGLQSALLLAKHELKHLTIKKHFGEIPAITCSPSQLNQVFLNLINNAAQAIESGSGELTLITRVEDAQHVAVEIADNGKGIRRKSSRRYLIRFSPPSRWVRAPGLDCRFL